MTGRRPLLKKEIKMGIFELAAELGKELKKDARVAALDEAKRVYESDEELQKYLIA